jgi:hypothetical protein
MQHIPLFKDEYLFSHWEDEFENYQKDKDAHVLDLLRSWNSRDKKLSETQLDGLFVEKLFRGLWGYWGTGTTGPIPGYSLLPQYPVPGAGQSGGTGKADLALAHFEHPDFSNIAQVLCEFKHIKSGLDAPQNRKDNNRSPVGQCLDYLKYSFDKVPTNPQVTPTWGIVTDMNEFRLYERTKGDSQYQRFVISKEGDDSCLLADNLNAQRSRFLFWKLFSREQLLTNHGDSQLKMLLQRQWTLEKALEQNFYEEYQAYRQHVYESFIAANPDFSGTRGDLVRMTQRFLDRCIFLLFCEDMGKALSFPTDLLRDILIRESCSESYSPDFENIWALVKQLFHTMRDGGEFPPDHKIHRFNGGLFEDLDALENLTIPNKVFCTQGQGESRERLAQSKNTLLYLSATYNFGTTSPDRKRTISLYALGRIFEQSITDLEYMHAEAEGVATVAKVSKRRRDGVYYTPEWVTHFIVQQVIGGRLQEYREEIGLELGAEFDAEELSKYRKARKKPKTNKASIHLEKLGKYEDFLEKITVLDPACGSGAFLIQALMFLQQQRRAIGFERARVTGEQFLFDQDAIIRGILADNLYGVDINPESVEITQLALWLNTASPGKPLSTLDDNIRCGNSLVGPEFENFYNSKHDTLFEDASASEREKVNAFDWASEFPEILGDDLPEDSRGFDCIIGNPPYVKLQHFRKVLPDVAEFLRSCEVESTKGEETVKNRVYESTNHKSFDMYLPFIERGISLLNSTGQLGYIAPSVWLLSDYGEDLKSHLLKNQKLDRWIDFKDFPVFEEAMTYTALQFFRGAPCDRIKFSAAPDGQLSSISTHGEIDYAALDPKDAWVFLPTSEKNFLERMATLHTQLSELSYVEGIFVGIQTSADVIYHLDKVGPGKYCQTGSGADGQTHEIEDEIMKPLISGGEAKRYQSPETNTYLLFPYDISGESPKLISKEVMTSSFPQAWEYLLNFETKLRGRESSSFDDEKWYRFGRNQNLDKQHLAKLGVAQTVPELRIFYDSNGEFCLNNVRVNGILAKQNREWFLMGILNSRVADFIFRRISKPKEPRPSGAYFEANKQYIAPISVPASTEEERVQVESYARKLNELHSSRKDTIAAIDSRLESSQMTADLKPPSWIWANVTSIDDLKEQNPNDLKGRALNQWAKQTHESLLNAEIENIENEIKFGMPMSAWETAGELKFFAGNKAVVKQVFVSENDAKIILPQWMKVARDKFISESLNAGRIVKNLLELRTTENDALVQQLGNLTKTLLETEEKILATERKLDDLVYELYKMNPEEKQLVELDTQKRSNARFPRPVATG